MDHPEIKQFVPADWKDYREIRLEALKNHPEYFCPSRDETQFNQEEWIERISNKNGAIFGLYQKREIIGLTGIIREKNNPKAQTAFMVMSYIKKEHRRRGLSNLFYKARIDWAKNEKTIKYLIIEHRDDNTPSKKAHEKLGTILIESKLQKWPDNTNGVCLVYKLDIK